MMWKCVQKKCSTQNASPNNNNNNNNNNDK